MRTVGVTTSRRNIAHLFCRGKCTLATDLLNAGEFFGVELITRELVGESGQQSASGGLVLVAKGRNCEQQAREWGKVVALLGGKTQPLDPFCFVGLRSRCAKNPTHRRRRGTQKVVLDSDRKESVVTGGVDGQQLLSRNAGRLHVSEAGNVALLDHRGV